MNYQKLFLMIRFFEKNLNKRFYLTAYLITRMSRFKIRFENYNF
jgi:hypothetical protein